MYLKSNYLKGINTILTKCEHQTLMTMFCRYLNEFPNTLSKEAKSLVTENINIYHNLGLANKEQLMCYAMLQQEMISEQTKRIKELNRLKSMDLGNCLMSIVYKYV